MCIERCICREMSGKMFTKNVNGGYLWEVGFQKILCFLLCTLLLEFLCKGNTKLFFKRYLQKRKKNEKSKDLAPEVFYSQILAGSCVTLRNGLLRSSELDLFISIHWSRHSSTEPSRKYYLINPQNNLWGTYDVTILKMRKLWKLEGSRE